jgi:hypothetical protein
MYGRAGQLCPAFGKIRSSEVRAKISLAKQGKKFPKISAAMTGRRLSKECKEKMSASASKRIAAGAQITGFAAKQYLQGSYKGFHFRSSYELAFLMQQEARGKTIGTDLLVEKIRIPFEFAGKNRVYVTDFYDVVTRQVYEVKHSRSLDDPFVTAKIKAATEFCTLNNMSFQVVTQLDLKDHVIDRKKARQCQHVVLDVDTYKREQQDD